MKVVFMLLVLINVAFALWEWRSGAIDESSQITHSQTSLLLSDEAVRARRGAFISGFLDRQVDDWQRDELLNTLARWQSAEYWQVAAIKLAKSQKYLPSIAAASPPKAQWVCHEIGPFSDLPTMKLWLKQRNLARNDSVVKEVNVAGDFQVHLPAAKRPEQLLANKQLLINKGITDFWMVPNGEIKGALSLGVFSDYQRALNFKSQLQSNGVNAEVKQRFKTQQQFYARVTLEKARREVLLGQGLQVLPCSR